MNKFSKSSTVRIIHIFKITILGPMLKRDYLKYIYLIVKNMDNLIFNIQRTPINGYLY